jgi:hypothetical protein
MTFKEAFIGAVFQFSFDSETKWWYVKVSADEALCVSASPSWPGAVGRLERITSCPNDEITLAKEIA